MILTHIHYDHAGGCNQLPSARFVMQRTELMAAAAPMGPKDLDIGGKDLFFDRKDVAGLVDDLWDRVDLIEGDTEILRDPLRRLPNSHTREANASTWRPKKGWSPSSGTWCERSISTSTVSSHPGCSTT